MLEPLRRGGQLVTRHQEMVAITPSKEEEGEFDTTDIRRRTCILTST